MSNDFGATKYDRLIHASKGGPKSNLVDVYSVLVAFNVTCPATAHAVKKLLCAGLRGKADRITDLKEAAVALQRAVDIAENAAHETPVP